MEHVSPGLRILLRPFSVTSMQPYIPHSYWLWGSLCADFFFHSHMYSALCVHLVSLQRFWIYSSTSLDVQPDLFYFSEVLIAFGKMGI